MTKKEEEILTTFIKLLPNLTEQEKDHLLHFGEGIAFKVQQEKEKEKTA